MSEFPFRIVGFDLDGTLVDSNRDLAPAINHALSTVDRAAIPPEATRKLIGGGARRMLERATELTGGTLPDDAFEAAFGELLVHYEAHIADNTVPYAGCLDALDALLDRGCKLAVITNKIEVYSRKLLDALGMTDRFAAILGGDTLGPGRAKPAPDMIDTAILLCGGKRTVELQAEREALAPRDFGEGMTIHPPQHADHELAGFGECHACPPRGQILEHDRTSAVGHDQPRRHAQRQPRRAAPAEAALHPYVPPHGLADTCSWLTSR